MRRLLGISILLAVMLSSSLFAQTTNGSTDYLILLKAELLTSKELLMKSDEAVKSLETALLEAKRSQEDSALTITGLQGSLEEAERARIDLETRITDLETQLAEGLKEQDRLQRHIAFLEMRLKELSGSLESLKKEYNDAELRHKLQIEKLITGYERSLKIYKVATVLLFFTSAFEAAYITISR